MSPVRLLLLLMLLPGAAGPAIGSVRLKELGHFLGWRDNALVGYGLVTGLAGSGDSPRSGATRQALSNVLSRLGANLAPEQLQSRNVAAVIVTATLPPAASLGDRIDATVTSIGDARSLVGGTLLMTPLLGPDQRPYALAQGELIVGGYNFQDSVNLRQKNYPTAGTLANGATVETPVEANLVDANHRLTFVLRNPDFTTAQRIAANINSTIGYGRAVVAGADKISIVAPDANPSALIASIESIGVEPDQLARVVINERSGTVVAGGPVQVSSVTIAQGDLKVSISVNNLVPQPYLYSGYGSPLPAGYGVGNYAGSSPYGGYGPGGYGDGSARGLVVTKLDVSDNTDDAVVTFPSTTVGDLVQALNRAKVGTRSTIAILQAIKAAGALQADIVVQ